jgi:hypothetical protein
MDNFMQKKNCETKLCFQQNESKGSELSYLETFIQIVMIPQFSIHQLINLSHKKKHFGGNSSAADELRRPKSSVVKLEQEKNYTENETIEKKNKTFALSCMGNCANVLHIMEHLHIFFR